MNRYRIKQIVRAKLIEAVNVKQCIERFIQELRKLDVEVDVTIASPHLIEVEFDDYPDFHRHDQVDNVYEIFKTTCEHIFNVLGYKWRVIEQNNAEFDKIVLSIKVTRR